MRSGMFVVGVLAGVFLAASIILASSIATPSIGSNAAVYGTAVTESTTTGFSSVSSASVPTPPVVSLRTASNATSTEVATTTANSSAYAMGALSSLSSAVGAEHQPPSRLDTMLSQPAQSLILLVPIAVALLLGLALHKASASGD
ncbi:MAG: hypothetical protein LYZ69_08875 [Nitrososphaerales archaeon]|nr:hypothetical protein [Nitrososphaerales archaeon]